MPSDSEWERRNEASARAARPNVILRLPCHTRGCRERLGALEFTTEPAATSPRCSAGFVNRSQAESSALRAVERHKAQLSAEAGDRLEQVIRDDDTDPAGIGARYLAAVADENYRSAFWRIIRDPNFGHLGMTAAETEAVRTVRHVSELRDSLRAQCWRARAAASPFPSRSILVS